MSEPLRIKAEADYMQGMKYKELAEKYGVTLNTIKSWKQRHNWDRKGVHTKSKKSMHTKSKGGAPIGNKNAVGNSSGGPVGNDRAVKHGFFQKHMPPEAFEIMQEIAQKDPLDMLWENITIQYTAIVRAQRIMYVRDQDDKTTTQIEERHGDTSWGQKWEVQQAWDKQATFLQAQSRAMSTLMSMIKQYDELLNAGLATEEQQARIAVLKSKIPSSNPDDMNAQITALADLINNPAPERVIDDV